MPEKGTIRTERRLAASPARVWAALTDPAFIARWWAPGDIRPVVGHRFDLDMGKWGRQAYEGMGDGWPRVLAQLEDALEGRR